MKDNHKHKRVVKASTVTTIVSVIIGYRMLVALWIALPANDHIHSEKSSEFHLHKHKPFIHGWHVLENMICRRLEEKRGGGGSWCALWIQHSSFRTLPKKESRDIQLWMHPFKYICACFACLQLNYTIRDSNMLSAHFVHSLRECRNMATNEIPFSVCSLFYIISVAKFPFSRVDLFSHRYM